MSMTLGERTAALAERWTPRRIAWVGGLFIAAIATLAAYDMLRAYRQVIAQTERDLDVQARVIAEQTTRSLQAVDTVLRHLTEQHRRGVLQRLSPDELHAYLKEQAVGLVQVDGLIVFGADGRGIGSSIVPPDQVVKVDLSKLPTFNRLREEPALRTMVGTTVRSLGTGRFVFPIGRRLEGPNGEYLGGVGASGQVDYFQRFYRDAYPEPGTRIALFHRNTTLIARHPPADEALGRKFALLSQLLDQAAAGRNVSRTVSPIDGVDRFGAVRAVPDHPLVILVTRDVASVLAPWREQAIGSALRTLALGALTALLLAMVQRQLARVAAAQGSLAVSEERYALAAAGSDTGVWDWDLVARTAYESRRARELQGLPLEPETQPLDALQGLLTYHPDDAPRRAAAMQAHLDGRTPHYEVEYRVRRADGTYRWIHVRALCIRASDGTPLRIAGSVTDIDARKRAEEVLRESEERYALAMTGSRGGHWVADLEADRMFVSDTVYDMLGLTPDGGPLTRSEHLARVHFHPDDRERALRIAADHAAGGVERVDYECRIVRPDGEVRWILNRAQRFVAPDGRGARIAGVSVDVTERKRAEAERERLEQQLRQAQKLEAIGTLAGGIAHDFNNILSAILGYGELAQKGAAEGSAQRRHIDAALAAGQRAKSLVERILAFSRSGVGERMPVQVQAVVHEALDAVAAALPAGVRLERRLAAGAAGVLGDPTQIHQVVMNLCANAVQAMRSEGRLEVTLDELRLDAPLAVSTSTLAAGAYLRLAVADTGSGIEPRVLERIFDPFFTTKEVGVGTGLGLSLVHGIVADLGGGIAVESRPGAGSTFTIYLPSLGRVAAPAGEGIDEQVVRGDGQVVLLVDDEEPLVRLGEELLAGLGYEPVGFVSSAAALEALRAEPARFDIVLSDESMPGPTGSELAAEARRLRPGLPVVLMSGYVSAALVQNARDAGVVEVLPKPLAAREIARALAAALRPRAG